MHERQAPKQGLHLVLVQVHGMRWCGEGVVRLHDEASVWTAALTLSWTTRKQFETLSGQSLLAEPMIQIAQKSQSYGGAKFVVPTSTHRWSFIGL